MGYITKNYLKTQFENFASKISSIFAKKGDVPTKTSQLKNDSITPDSIGLGNVNNTSDEDKPVSKAQQSAIDTAYANISLTANKLEVGLNKLNYFLPSENQNPSYAVTENSSDTMYMNGRGAQRTSSERALFVKYNSPSGYCGYALAGLTSTSVGTKALTNYGATTVKSRTTPSRITYYIAHLSSAWAGGGSSGGERPVNVTVSGKSFNIVKTMYNLYPGQENSALALDVLVDIVLVSGYSVSSDMPVGVMNTKKMEANTTYTITAQFLTASGTMSFLDEIQVKFGATGYSSGLYSFVINNYIPRLDISNTNNSAYTLSSSHTGITLTIKFTPKVNGVFIYSNEWGTTIV